MRRVFGVLVACWAIGGCVFSASSPAGQGPGEVGIAGFPRFAEDGMIPDHLFDRRETAGPPAAVPGTFLEKRTVRSEQYTYPAELVAVVDGCGIYASRQWVRAEEQTWDLSGREPRLVEATELYSFWMERYFQVCPGRAAVQLPYYDDLQAVGEERTEDASMRAGREEIVRAGLRPRPAGATPPPGTDGKHWRPPEELPADFAHGFAEHPDEGTAHVTVERVWILEAVQVHECVVYASYRGYYRIHRRDAAGNELPDSPEWQEATNGSGPIWRYEQWTIDGCPGDGGTSYVEPPVSEPEPVSCQEAEDCFACCELLAEEACFAACEAR